MRALVTGSAGFIGRHMVSELESRGWEIVKCDINPSTTALDALDCFKGYRYSPFYDGWFDLVVHCAYHVGGRASIDGTNTNLLKNLQLDSSMFEWAVRTKQKRVLYFSSSAVYPVGLQSKDWVERETGPYYQYTVDELRLQEDWFEAPLNDLEPSAADADYGYAKAVGERLAQNARDNGVPVTIVRPFSGYSEDQSTDYPFPAILQRVRSGDLSVWGPPGQSRDWIHVDDLVRGALAVVESGTEEPVNLCTGVGTEMGELAKLIASEAHLVDCFKYPGVTSEVTYDELAPTGVFYRVGDPERMKKYYEPKISITEGIRRALAANQ